MVGMDCRLEESPLNILPVRYLILISLAPLAVVLASWLMPIRARRERNLARLLSISGTVKRFTK